MSEFIPYYKNNESKEIILEDKIAKISIKYDRTVKPSEMIKIVNSDTASKVFREIWNNDLLNYTEEFKIMLLNNSNKVIGIFDVSKGGQTGTLVDVRTVLTVALSAGSTGICLCHNHPSGTLTPSEADKKLTKKICEAAQLMDIKVLDHIILTQEEYYSFADQGDFY